MKKGLVLLLFIGGYGLSGLKAQTTASFNFSLASHPVTGWTNVYGDPALDTITATDATTGIGISSVSPTHWAPLSGSCASDGYGASGGVFFPTGVMANHWFQYGSLGNYNAAIPQLLISGLNVDSVYTFKMSSSNITGVNTNPSRYTVIGAGVVGYQDVNTRNNTTDGATFYNVAPDATGKVMVFVSTVNGSGDEAADISGLQIIRGRTTAPTPVVTITSPDNNDILAEDGNITINATATETGGTIKKVEFYADTTKLGEDSTSPYSYTWVNPNEGNYVIKARAIDATGNANTVSINISVQSLTTFWSLTGNIGANADSNFLGTVDSNRLAIRTNNLERVSILGDGSVGIGTKNTFGYKLAVDGNAIFTKVRIKAYAAWPDYVFEKGYRLPGLDSLEKYIRLHQHLPGVAPAEEVKKEGMDIAEAQAVLLKKVEELTLYLLQEHKNVEKLAREVKQLRLKNQQLQTQNNRKGK